MVMRLRPVLVVLAGVALLALFTREISDFDFWWTLASGRYIAQTHHLPDPDPFAYTTATAHDTYAGESTVRHFNLTFEWLAQLIFYGVYSAGGFAAFVLFRGVLLAASCGLFGWIAWRRSGGYYRGIAAAFLCALVLIPVANDRSYLFTFLFLALTLAVLEVAQASWPAQLVSRTSAPQPPSASSKPLWLLPVIALVWANCHGGFFLQWIAVGAYCVDARRKPVARRLWIALGACVLASGINPNGYRVIQVLGYFRSSFLQSKLLEWRAPSLWPLSLFSALLLAAAGVMIWASLRPGRRVRIADWLLFAAFAAAALTAQRNIFLIAFWAPVILATYIPWKRTLPAVADYAAAAVLIAALAVPVARGEAFQLRAAEWRFPSGAAGFLLAHDVQAPLFNTYEFGGYLIWRLWPHDRVFIDGRALSESVFNDYARILYNHSNADGGPTGQELLDRYNVQAIVMNGFEYSEGLAYNLMLSLSGPQTKWKLVYNDPQAVVFMRDAPAGVTPLSNDAVFSHLESECELHIEREPKFTLCARAMGQIFGRVGQMDRMRKWLSYYLSLPHPPDAEAEAAYRQLLSTGR